MLTAPLLIFGITRVPYCDSSKRNDLRTRLQNAGSSPSALLIRRKAMDSELILSGGLQACLVSILYKQANIINKHRRASYVEDVGLKASTCADFWNDLDMGAGGRNFDISENLLNRQAQHQEQEMNLQIQCMND